MDIALAQCPPWGSLPPLGLASLKAFIEQHGHSVRCIDLNIDYCRERLAELLDDEGGSVYDRPDPWASGSYEEWAFDFDGEVRFTSALKERPLPIQRWADEILSSAPRVVGFSVQTTNLGVTLQVAQHVRRLAPSALIVFGGPNVAELQQGTMALATGIPDVVVEGEGEVTLLDLMESFQAGRDLGTVAGIGRLVDGRPTWTGRRPLLRDVDELPFPDFSDFDWDMYPNPYEIPIMTSRGCVLSCAFCYETVYWKRFRTQSPHRIVAEIQHQIAQHPGRAVVEAGHARFGMAFADSLVNGHLGGLRRTAELLIQSGTDIYWNGQATINTKMDDEYFRILAASGCSGLSFGLESGSASVLESMGKRFQIDEATAFFQRVHRSGIELVVNIMVGFPTETRADFLETLRFLARIRRHISMVNNVGATAVVGGSRLHQTPEQFGVVPAHAQQWIDGVNLDWRTDAAGGERNRLRRVRLLHAWMTVLRIPHQRIGPLSRLATMFGRGSQGLTIEASGLETMKQPQTMPTELVQARVEDLTRTLGAEALLLHVDGTVVDGPIVTPQWAERLKPDEWAGVSSIDLRNIIRPLLGADLDLIEDMDGDGVLEVRIRVVRPISSDLKALRVYVFPAPEGDRQRLIALFPDRPERTRPVLAVGSQVAVNLRRRRRSEPMA